MKLKRMAIVFPMTLAALLGAGSALAFSDKPVKLIVPAPPGGTIDVFARIISDQLSQHWHCFALFGSHP